MFLNMIWETLSYRETQKKIRVIGKKSLISDIQNERDMLLGGGGRGDWKFG